jgi:hypothetical protein
MVSGRGLAATWPIERRQNTGLTGFTTADEINPRSILFAGGRHEDIFDHTDRCCFGDLGSDPQPC